MKLVGENQWLALPSGCNELNNFTCLKPFQEDNPACFNYSFNKDGTISPIKRPDLVFGLTNPNLCEEWRKHAEHLGWIESLVEKKEQEAAEQAIINVLPDEIKDL